MITPIGSVPAIGGLGSVGAVSGGGSGGGSGGVTAGSSVAGSGTGGVGGVGGQLGQLNTGGAQSDVSDSEGGSFGDMLKDMLIKRPTESQAKADGMAADFAAGKNIDPHSLAIATATAGVEVQMATRTISQAVQAVRTLFQMQI